MGINPIVLKQINQSTEIKAKISIAAGKSAHTIQRWVNNNDIMLTTAGVLQVLRTELELSDDQLLTSQIIISDGGDEVEHITEAQ